jgi:type I restriction enzyme M protein
VLFIDARQIGFMKDRVLRDFTREDIAKLPTPSTNGRRIKTTKTKPDSASRQRWKISRKTTLC